MVCVECLCNEFICEGILEVNYIINCKCIEMFVVCE